MLVPDSRQTLESDSYICVRQKLTEEASPEVLIIDLKNANNVIRRPIKADSAIMHWTREVIALKAQQRTLQIFDLAQKQKLKSATMNEDVVFWKWFSPREPGPRDRHLRLPLERLRPHPGGAGQGL